MTLHSKTPVFLKPATSMLASAPQRVTGLKDSLINLLTVSFPLPGHLVEQFLPNPQHGYGTNYTEDEVGEIAFAK